MATGIRRIKEYYIGCAHQPEFDVKENSIKVVLPKVVPEKRTTPKYLSYDDLTKVEMDIIYLIDEEGAITRKEAEELLNKGKTQTYKILKKLVDKGCIFAVSKGKSTKYLIR